MWLFFDQRAKPLPEQLVIIGKDNPYAHNVTFVLTKLLID
jgi:hypothetical protein